MRKLISILMVLCLFVCSFPFVSVNADDLVGEFKYEIYGEDAWLIGYNGSDTDVVIPDTYEGYNVIAIDSYAFKNHTEITSVIIPDTVTYIGAGAFCYCSNLKSVKFSDNLKTVQGQAFYNCPLLSEVSLSDKVIEIYDYAFGYYEDFKSGDVFKIEGFKISGWENTAAQVYANDNEISFVSLGIASPWKYTIDGELVIIDKYLGVQEDVVVPEKIEDCDVVTISGSTFSGNTVIKSVTVPNTVTYIGRGAFRDCSNLSVINLPDYVSVGDKVFEGTAFYNNEKNWENGILYLNKLLIKAKSDIKSVSFKDGIRIICPHAFEDCINLTSVTIPSTISDIDENAFEGCTSLKEVKFERSLQESTDGYYFNSETYVADYAFLDCPQLTSVKLPENVIHISLYAFGYSYEYVDSLGSWSYVKNDSFTVYGVKDTGAEDFASRNSFTFIEYDFANEPVDEPSETPTDTSKSTTTDCTHTTVIKNKKSASYFAEGYSGDSVCSKCGKVISKGKTTEKITLGVPSIKVKSGKKLLKVTLNKKVNGATGFQVRYRIKGKWKTVKFNFNKKITKKIKKIKKGNFKVQVRMFVKNGKNIAYSAWTKTQKVKVK